MLEQTRYYQLIQRLYELRNVDILDKVVDASIKFAMAELNRDQLMEGERADGLSLPDYSPTSVNIYGKAPGPIKLLDTGAFHDSIIVIAADNAYRFLSSPLKRDEITGRITNLKEKYGDEIIGLGKDGLDEIRQKVKIKIVEHVNKLLKS